MPYKKKEFSAFLKKLERKKEKIPIISVSRTTLCTQEIKFCMQKKILENVCLCTKTDLRLKKKQKKFWGKL